MIEARIGRLPPALRGVLQAASVEGEDFTAEVVAQVQMHSARDVVRLLSAELDRGHRLVSAQGVAAGGAQRITRYRFRHNLVQTYLYTSLDVAERGYLHAAEADALEALYAGQRELVAVQLAHHYEAASRHEQAVDSESGAESGAAPSGKQAARPTPTPTPEPDSGGGDGNGVPTGDGEGGDGDGAEPLQDPEVDFEVDPASIEAGRCATLRWTVRHVRQYFVDGDGKAGDTGEQEVCPEATTTYTLRVMTLAGEQEDYTVEVAVVGEPPVEMTGEAPGMAPGETLDEITVDDAEVLDEPWDLKGVNDKPGIQAVAIADCAEARKLKCADMDQYQSNPSFGKSTKACLVWVEQGAPFGSIAIAVRREAPNPQTEL